MDLDEGYEMNEEAREPLVEKHECWICGFRLTMAEEEDPCIIKVPVTKGIHIPRVVCDKCGSEYTALTKSDES